MAYIQSPQWIAFCSEVKKMWGYRCAICYRRGPLQVHHRTYERLGQELFSDVIPVCSKVCHPFADKRRQIAARQERR